MLAQLELESMPYSTSQLDMLVSQHAYMHVLYMCWPIIQLPVCQPDRPFYCLLVCVHLTGGCVPFEVPPALAILTSKAASFSYITWPVSAANQVHGPLLAS